MQQDVKTGPQLSAPSEHSGLSGLSEPPRLAGPSRLSGLCEGPFCVYPPKVLDQVDVTEQNEGDTRRYVVRNRANSRYFLLKPTEFQVFSRIDGSTSLSQIAVPENGAGLRASRQAVAKFLGKLDSLGLLARGGPAIGSDRADKGLYPRFSLFNPDRFLGWLDRRIGFLLGRPFIAGSFVMMGVVALGMLIRGAEAAAYTSYIYSTYGLAIILAFTLVITTLHEFAHGLACKHFGGQVPEVGLLMIFYVVPAFYCNVSDVYRFGRKRDRVWVIAAGIYWQLLVGASGALVWLMATPQTALADFAFLLLLSATFNILINCNPLIKLDGYYALSQMLGIQNLQSRSSEYVRSLVMRVIDGPGMQGRRVRSGRSTRTVRAVAGDFVGVQGEYGRYQDRGAAAEPPIVGVSRMSEAAMEHASAGTERTGEAGSEPRAFYLVYWLLSIVYSVALIWLVVAQLGDALMNQLGIIGALLTLALVFLVGQRFLRPAMRGLRVWGVRRVQGVQRVRRVQRVFGEMAGVSGLGLRVEERTMQNIEVEHAMSKPRARYSRRTWVKAGVAVFVVAVIVAPWEASAGSDCALLLPPGHEAPVRAGVDATLAEVFVAPGDTVAEGARVARMANPELEDRLTQLNAEITRLDNRNSEIEETLQVRSEELLSANFKEQDRARLAAELKDEAVQIERAKTIAPAGLANPASAAGPTGALPAALAVLQSDIELKQTQLEYNRNEVKRYRKLYEQGLVGSIQYDAAVNAARMNEKELQQARARLDAALVDHHRLVNSTETNQLVAQTEARAARSNFQALITELHANREQLASLRDRRLILQREYDSMNVLAPRAGIILGEDLRKTIGGHFSLGQEICRIGELERFLLQIDVNERDIADVKLDSPVRFKMKTVPGRTFTGRVSKIRAESANNQYGQRVYPVEVVVENSDGMLRPGMTGFARISFGRQSIGLIAAQKVWQALRPETWLF